MKFDNLTKWLVGALAAAAMLSGVSFAQTPATRAALEAQVNAAITTNGQGQITGAKLNSILNNIIASMAALLDANNFTGSIPTINGAPIRTPLSGGTFLYVNADPSNPQTCGTLGQFSCAPGNDTTGTGTVAAPYLTLNKACLVVQSNYDTNGQRLTVMLAHGVSLNYGGALCTGALPGASDFAIAGDDNAPTAVGIVSPNGGYGVQVRDFTGVTFRSLEFTDQGSAIAGLALGQNSLSDMKGVSFGAFNSSAAQILEIQSGASINLSVPISGTAISVLGGAGSFLKIGAGASIYFTGAFNGTAGQVSIPNAVAYSNGLINATGPAALYGLTSTTFTGAGVAGTTGVRAKLAGPVYLQGDGSGCSVIFPGNSPCQLTQGAQTAGNDAQTSINPSGGSGTVAVGNYLTCLLGVNMQVTNTDYQLPVPLNSTTTKYIASNVRIFNASGDISAATFSMWTAAGGTGTALISSATAITVTTATANTNNNTQTVGVNNSNTTEWNVSPLFLRVQSPSGAAQTADLCLNYTPAY